MGKAEDGAKLLQEVDARRVEPQGPLPNTLPHSHSTVPTGAYHFPPLDVKGPRLCLLECVGGDLCPQASWAVQSPDVQVGANSLKEKKRSVICVVPGLTHRGFTLTHTEERHERAGDPNGRHCEPTALAK